MTQYYLVCNLLDYHTLQIGQQMAAIFREWSLTELLRQWIHITLTHKIHMNFDLYIVIYWKISGKNMK